MHGIGAWVVHGWCMGAWPSGGVDVEMGCLFYCELDANIMNEMPFYTLVSIAQLKVSVS